MATLQLYNHTAEKLLNNDFDTSHTYKVMLLSSAAAFNASHTTLTEVSSANAWEMWGYGWAQLGEILQNVAVSTHNTNGAMFDADDIAKAISGGNLGPFQALVVYDDTETNDPPVVYLQLTSEQTIADGGVAAFFWPTDGIVKASVV